MSKFFKHFRWMHLIVIGAMLLATMGFTTIPIAQSTCGLTYTVQSGDNLSRIAKTCDTTVNALLQANPQIVNPSLIYPGEVLSIPQNIVPVTGSQIQLTPANGQAGTQVTVNGTAFPASSTLNLTVAQQGASPASTTTINTDNSGNFTTQVTIPNSAQPGSAWTITAATQASSGPSASAIFTVIAQPVSGYYTVQSGDTLTSIAQRFNTTVSALLRANPKITNANQLTVGEQILIPGSEAVIPNTGQPVYVVQQGDSLSVIAANLGISLNALLQANPQITNPSLIFPGEVLNLPNNVIPVTGPQLQIIPSSGQAGAQVTVSGTAFPASSSLNLAVAQQGGSPASTTTVNTNSNGNFTTQVTIPSSAQVGSTWTITATAQTNGGPSASATFDVAAEQTSGYYTVQSGDTLSSIAQRFNTTVSALQRANPNITNTNQITVGQQILIPGSLAVIPNTGQPVYVVKQGDSLSVIAATLGVSLSALEALNPQITTPSLIYPGEVLNIPNNVIPVTGPQVQLTPSNGQAGTQVAVSGTAFPANTALNLSVAQQGASPAATTTVSTDSNGNFTTQVTIPNSAQSGSTWIVTVATQASGGPSASASFLVSTGTSQGTTYMVQSGDTLSSLAQRFGVSVEMLLQANPQLNQLSTGQTINIPQTIHFSRGATSQVIQGKLNANSSRYYVLYAQANQLLQVSLTPQSGLSLSVTGLDGNVLKNSYTGGAAFRGTLPGTQYYVLDVSSGNNAITYTMDVNIPARISFSSGATSASVNGTLAANSNQYYILTANKNQAMQVQVTPQQGLKLAVYGVDGAVLQSGMSGAASFSGTIPSSQDYILELSPTSSSSNAISYTLQVTITSPQSVIPNTGQTVYIVQQGDTLSGIAQRFGTTTSALMQANPQITQASLIFPGERLVIPNS